MSPTNVELAAGSLPSEDMAADDSAARRRYCTWLQYWRGCPTALCRRARACRGDPTACFARHWPHYSPVAQVWIDAGTHALDQGLTARTAMLAADLALLSYVKSAEFLPRHRPRRKKWRGVEEADEPATS
jgi:hypothetical protein